jgi:hypothetical protein
MKLTDIFERPVDRPIEGVIKADDQRSLLQEVEEYVLTNEVEKRLSKFLDAYTIDPLSASRDVVYANGVWISGFFGSGKSHLLKMLAFLLENRSVDGKPVLDIFKEKIKHNEILRADLEKACSIPSESILFNIDQKADVISKSQADALLSVFVKVFDEHCGYYGKQPFVAQFERELDLEGKLPEFKTRFLEYSGKDWDFGRVRVNRFSNDIDKAYVTVTGQNISGIIEKFRADYRLSIEDFAEQVSSYISSRGKGFRLNFFVDEAGQYVADNQKLMTNLQTVAESLGTKCNGRSWIIVTAQEDMNTVIGEMGKQQSNDFSKIQARFANRLKLTSQDVAEVIQKRLLAKKHQGVEILTEVYHEEHSNFKTLFDFTDGSQTFKNFQDKEHFIHSYPFIPYQYPLFQAAIQSLSDHNAFEGKHSSVGERSMLGVFRDVAIKLTEKNIGQLATFDLMYEGIRTALKTKIQSSISRAEQHLQHSFAVRLLKALFLVKYVKGFKATPRNLCILMQEEFGQSIAALRQNVEEALALLEQETYIQRNGELYEFLTDEEKDVEQEIKNTEVDSKDVSEELAKILFDQIIKDRKIRYDDNGHDYAFSRKLDDQLYGRDYELAVHVISPFHENCGNIDILKSNFLGKPEITLVLLQDDRIYRDLILYKKTDKYVRLNQGSAQQEVVARILIEKAQQNRKRYEELLTRLAIQTGKARVLVSGEEMELDTTDPNTKVVKAFFDLITRVYPNLRMLRRTNYREEDVANYLQGSGETLFGNDAVSMSEPEQEMMSVIQTNSIASGVRTTLKALVEKFEKKPYGWHLGGILCIAAKLCARGKVEVRKDSRILEEKDLLIAFRNTAEHAHLVLIPQIEFTPAQVRELKYFYEEFFDTGSGSNEPKILGKDVAEAFAAKVSELEKLVADSGHLVFISKLTPVIEFYKSFCRKSYSFYLTEMLKQEDKLFEMKETVADPIIRFINGSGYTLFNDAVEFYKTNEPNMNYLPSEDVQTLSKLLSDPDGYKSANVQTLRTVLEGMREKLKTKIAETVEQANRKIEVLQCKVAQMPEYGVLAPDREREIHTCFSSVKEKITAQTLIPVIYDIVRNFEDFEYNSILNRIERWGKPQEPVKPEYEAKPVSGEGSPHGKKCEEPVQQYVPLKNITVGFERPYLANEEDVEEYIKELKKVIMEEIKLGKRVRI